MSTIAVSGTQTLPGGAGSSPLRRLAGPGLLVAVGYMDPGNWATDIAGAAHRAPFAGAAGQGGVAGG